MIKTSMWLDEQDIEFIRSLGFTMTGFLRSKISELKNEKNSGRRLLAQPPTDMGKQRPPTRRSIP